jgi:ubiquinone/menaquinone biosynthesis C-methylase UbiE
VWCIDIREYEYAELLSNVRCIVGDIRKTNFDAGFFDVVTVVSTIEHIGLGRYADSVDVNGDKLAMKEIRRVLSTDGFSLITLPFGKRMTYASHRVYDKESLKALLKGFTVEREDYYSRTVSTGFWRPCTAEDLTEVTSPKYENGLVCVKVKKKQ